MLARCASEQVKFQSFAENYNATIAMLSGILDPLLQLFCVQGRLKLFPNLAYAHVDLFLEEQCEVCHLLPQ